MSAGMLMILIAAGCLLGSAALWKHAFNFTVDAAPVGNMMLVASIAMAETSVFLFGFAFGKFL